jgi:hypothetical protein
MEKAYEMSRADTYTPVSYWMAMPFRNVKRWRAAIFAVQARDKKE